MVIKSLREISLEGTDLILLDLDNTLYSYKPCHEFALNQLISECQKRFENTREYFHELYYSCRSIVHDRHHGTANEHSRLFYIQFMIEKICGCTDIHHTRSLYNIYWESYIQHMVLFDDAISFLEESLLLGIPVVIVTDMVAEIQFKKIEKLELQKYFQYIVSSDEAGVEKPDPFIFELAIKKALFQNPSIQRIKVVGDNTKKDIFRSEKYEVEIFHLLKNE